MQVQYWEFKDILCLNVNVLAQILVAWFGYMTERKRKKERITHALERRRTRQIRQGVTQWIAVATDLSGMRAKIAAQQHAQVRESGNFKYSVKTQCAVACKLEYNLFFLFKSHDKLE